MKRVTTFRSRREMSLSKLFQGRLPQKVIRTGGKHRAAFGGFEIDHVRANERIRRVARQGTATGTSKSSKVTPKCD